MLELIELACIRGERTLFSGVSLQLAGGQCLHVAGENGTGKTSLLRIVCALMQPAAGSLRWQGQAIVTLGEAYFESLVYVGHLNGVKDDLTALENLRVGSTIAGHRMGEARLLSALDSFALGRFAHAPARTLSQGQRRRIALARLMLAREPLWVLDEPYTALDTLGVATLADCISTHQKNGGIVVMTTHQNVALRGPVMQLTLRTLLAHAATPANS